MGRFKFCPVRVHFHHDGGAAERRKKTEEDGLVRGEYWKSSAMPITDAMVKAPGGRRR